MRISRLLLASVLITTTVMGAALGSVSAGASTRLRPAAELRLSARAQHSLLELYAAFRHIPASDIGRIDPGGEFAARVNRTGAEWAVLKFVPSAKAPPGVAAGFQDGAATGLFTRPAGGRWRVTGLGGRLLACDARLPVQVRRLWGFGRCPAAAPRVPRAIPAEAGTMNDVASIAEGEVGVQDSPPSTDFGFNCNPFTALEYPAAPSGGCDVDTSFNVLDHSELWCADFAKWVWTQAGVTSNVATLGPGANSFLAWGYDSGQSLVLDGSNAQVGDAIVLFPSGTFSSSSQLYTSSPPTADHVGIVTGVNSDGTLDYVNGDMPWGDDNYIRVSTPGVGMTPASFANAAEISTSEQWVFISPQLSSGGTPPPPNSPTAGVDSSFNVYTFWKGTDGNLWENNRTGSGSWTGAHKIADMGVLGSQPTVAVTSAGNQYVFWKGTNSGYLYEAYYLNGTWNGPNKVTDTSGDPIGPMGSPPTAGVDSSGNVYVFWVNPADNGLEETSGKGYQPGSFSGYHEIPNTAPLGSTPTVAVTSSGNQYVFWQDASGYLYEAYNLNGAWNGPSKITDSSNSKMGPMASAPTAGVDSSGNVYVFWENSTDNGLEETSGKGYQPGSFNTQHEISSMAPLGSAPAVAVAADGNQLVFWKGANSSEDLFEANWNGSWNGPTNLGGGPLG
jgi:hypothetical protein